MLRTVLVALEESSYADNATALALEWGTRFGAHLLGLGILDKPSITTPEPIPLGASAFRKSLEDRRLNDAQERVLGLL